MTDPFARPADQPADGEVTIPLVPDSGYAQPSQAPFGEETLVDPLASSPWSGAQDFGYTPTPGYTAPSQGPATGSQSAPVGGYPAAADYWRGPTPPPEVNQPQAASPAGQPYVQPTYQPHPAPPAGHAQPGYAQPQNGYGQPQPGYAEPSAPAVYQPYPQATQPAAPQWPATIQDPVAYDYGYSYGYGPAAVDHPNSIPALVLGIIGLVLFPLVAPVAWHLGAKGQREARMDPNRWRASGALTAGKILGIIGTVFMGMVVLFFIFIIGMVVTFGG